MDTKNWYKSKTVWFNGLTILIAVATFFGFTMNQDLFNQVSVVLLAMSPVVNFALRLVTKQPIK